MPRRLSVPYFPQSRPGDCLVACAQMVLAYRGSAYDQAHLARQLGIESHLGAPARNIHRLASSKHHVIVDKGDADKLRQWLNNDTPIIAFVQASELPHWRGEYFQHAVVVVEIDQQFIWMLDPDAGDEPIAAGIDYFMLAWSELDYLYAVITD